MILASKDDGDIQVDENRFARFAQQVMDRGKYSSRFMTKEEAVSDRVSVALSQSGSDKGMIFRWDLEDFALCLEKWEKMNLPLYQDFYILIGRDWEVAFLWQRGSRFDIKQGFFAFGAFGKICCLNITNFESFKRDWAIMTMFDDSP